MKKAARKGSLFHSFPADYISVLKTVPTLQHLLEMSKNTFNAFKNEQ
jgi:hypothetical protein